jgi:hypothetical protein
MDADERDICFFLKGWPGQFVALAEISRRASGKRREEKEPGWAVPALGRLVEKGILESDSTGHYRLKRRGDKGTRAGAISPYVRKILEQSGKTFEIEPEEGDDDFIKYL